MTSEPQLFGFPLDAGMLGAPEVPRNVGILWPSRSTGTLSSEETHGTFKPRGSAEFLKSIVSRNQSKGLADVANIQNVSIPIRAAGAHFSL